MNPETAILSVSPMEVYRMSQSGEVELIDVSTPAEHRGARVPFAINVPIDSPALNRMMDERSCQCARPLYVMCSGGVRSVKVCKLYPNANLVNVEGGTRNWTQCGLPVARDKKTRTLNHQVAIATGILAIGGAALSFLAHPYFLIACAFVGAELILTGLKDTCLTKMLLSRMRWNRAVLRQESTLQRSCSN